MDKIKRIIELAIARENDCYVFFLKKADAAVTEQLQNFFSEQAQEDLEHCEKLKAMLMDKIDKYNMTFIDDILQEPFLKPLTVEDSDCLTDILQMVSNKKQEAAIFYSKMAEIAPSHDLKNKYYNLANIELGLRNRVSNKVVELLKRTKEREE